MHSIDPNTSPLAISIVLGEQFCNNTVTSPSWLVTTRPGPPLRRGACGALTVATAVMPAGGLNPCASNAFTRIGCVDKGGTLCAEIALIVPV